MSYLFVLGADDPEMSAIEALLRRRGQPVTHAESASGVRVHAGNAYQALAPLVGPSDVATLVFIECGVADGADWTPPERIIRVDHHRPGDPGYGKSPDEYFEASSFGQICALLGLRANKQEHLFVAAADHCLAAAYAGKCPGVDPKSLRAWRVAQRAAFQKRSHAEIESDTRAAEAALEAAPQIEIGGVLLADLRGQHVAELPEAACIAGVGYLADIEERNGRRKVVVGGCGEGTLPGVAPVREFLATWASAQGLTGAYGDPVRGFAGAYL